MESMRKAFRVGVEPLLSYDGLLALRKALAENDPALLQGATTLPPPLECVENWDCEGACLIGYAFWKGDGLGSVGEVEQAFAKVCYEADMALGEPAGIRHFLNPADELPRNEMRQIMLEEVTRALDIRDASARVDAIANGVM